jgi:hypothetical protein
VAASYRRSSGRSVFNTPDAVLHFDLEGLLHGDYAAHAQALINLVRSGVVSQRRKRRAELGYNPRGGAADTLRPQAVGGRPDGAGDGEGNSLPDPGLIAGGRKPGNGAATLQ